MKKRLKMKRLAVIAALSALICAIPAFTPISLHAEEIRTDSTGSYQYVRNGRYAKIVKYLGTIEMDAEKTYTLPSELDGYTVNEIGDDAFAEYSVPSKKLVIPDTVSAIDDRAFKFLTDDEGYPLTKGVCIEQVTLPNSLMYIGEQAFAYNNISAVTIPGSVKFMGKRCFNGILKTLVVEEGVRRIDDAAFDSCGALTKISLPSTLVGIGKDAFGSLWTYGDARGTLNLVIPDSVTEIGERAFASGNLLGSVKLGAGLQTIGDEAFAGCAALSKVDTSDCRSLRYIGKEAFTVTALKTFTLSETEEEFEIGDRAFYACEDMRSISVPDNTYFGKESVGYVYSKKARGYVLTDKLTVKCISSGSFKPSKYDTILSVYTSQAAVYSLYKNVGLKANFVVKATDTGLMKFHKGTKFRLVISGNKGLKWKSSNPKVARISANGSVATISPGTTTLKTVLNDGKSYSCKLKVIKAAS